MISLIQNFLRHTAVYAGSCRTSLCLFGMILLASCNNETEYTTEVWIADSLSAITASVRSDSLEPRTTTDSTSPGVERGPANQLPTPSTPGITTGTATPGEVMRFAETLIGTPYAWASIDPAKGFDCSGFITYVFTHFNIRVPRSSIDFTDVGKTVPVNAAKRGDIILFTGTNPLETTVGHMGLVVANGAEGLDFIHATSGKAMAVTVTRLTNQYLKRFVRVTRIFPQND